MLLENMFGIPSSLRAVGLEAAHLNVCICLSQMLSGILMPRETFGHSYQSISVQAQIGRRFWLTLEFQMSFINIVRKQVYENPSYIMKNVHKPTLKTIVDNGWWFKSQRQRTRTAGVMMPCQGEYILSVKHMMRWLYIRHHFPTLTLATTMHVTPAEFITYSTHRYPFSIRIATNTLLSSMDSPCKLNAACFLSRITGESQTIICGCFTNHLMCFFFFYQQLWHGRGEDNATSPGCVTSRHLRLWIKESRWQPGSRRTSVQLSPFIKPVLLEHGTTNETPRSKSFINLTLSHRVGQLSSHYSNWTREQIVVFPNAHPVLGCVSMIYPFCTRAHCDPQI